MFDLYKLVTLFALHCCICLQGQPQRAGLLDTMNYLTQEKYFQWIVDHHPVSKQAGIFNLEADAKMLKARGGFDPKFYGDIDQKSFDQKSYYTVGETGVELPSQLGLKFKGAHTWSRGQFLNPQNNLPAQGQTVLGISAEVGQGLLIDERRADLQQARVARDAASTERQLLLIDLLEQGNEVYWNWVFINQVRQIYRRAVEVAYQRLENTVESYLNGDKPAIDTLESFIQWQNRQTAYLEADLARQNSAVLLTNYLWTKEELPILRPDDLQAPVLNELPPIEPVVARRLILADVPALRRYDFKLRSLEVERRLKTDKLKPRITLEYNFLGRGSNFLPDEEANFQDLLLQNYKWGIKVGFPLFLRKARGDIELVKLKQTATVWQRTTKRQEVNAKIQAFRNEISTIVDQVALNEELVDSYGNLLEAENLKFSIGESSLFLINAREQKLLEAQIKLAKLKVQYYKMLTKLRLVDGTLIRQY